MINHSTCTLKHFSVALLLSILSSSAFGYQRSVVDLAHGLFNDQVQDVCQDEDGMLWLATRHGLASFDGMKVVNHYPSRSGGGAASNDILDLAEDSCFIYFVNRAGFGIFDKSRNSFRFPDASAISAPMWLVEVLEGGTVVIGHHAGLARYNPATDCVEPLEVPVDGGAPFRMPVKSFHHDAHDNLWIGTWSSGFYRYSPAENKIYSYPRVGLYDCVTSSFVDNEGTLWVGTWCEGLFTLKHPTNAAKAVWNPLQPLQKQLADRHIYSISQDPATGNMWLGHNRGVSVLTSSGELLPLRQPSGAEITGAEVNRIFVDNEQTMWLATIGEGGIGVITRPNVFPDSNPRLPAIYSLSAAVSAAHIDPNGDIWVGLGAFGVAKLSPGAREWEHPRMELGYTSSENIASVYSILERRNGDLWLGTFGGDIIVLDKERRLQYTYSHKTDRFIPQEHIVKLFEDDHDNVWVGTAKKAGVLMADGREIVLSQINDRVVDIALLDGRIFIATQSTGVFKITGDLPNPSTWKLTNIEVPPYGNWTQHINTLLVADTVMLAGTDGGGVFRYDRNADCFVDTKMIPRNPDLSIQALCVDDHRNLWIGTNNGLFVKSEGRPPLKFTRTDGLPSEVVLSNIHFRHGRMVVGTSKGIEEFSPEEALQKYARRPELRFGITDLLILNRSFSALPRELQGKVTDGLVPSAADKITIPADCNNFSLEFALFSFRNPEKAHFAYRLEGYDEEWVYADGNSRYASYTNLPAGSYEFVLHASNEHGEWCNDEYRVRLEVLAPWYKTRTAYTCYGIALSLLLFLSIRGWKRHDNETKRIQRLEYEKESIQQMNHTKLVFFTNITHELLTPLTIISAAVEELKVSSHGPVRVFDTINVNIQRLIKLLQQILEFRKAESKSLKLRVSYGNISEFVSREVCAFGPLINKKNITLDMQMQQEPIMGYFDPDKLDKIMYNLLSNAAKYTPDGSTVRISLSLVDNREIQLSVADNGKGIPSDKIDSIFVPFYEGEYREFKTIGTGIGLTLTRDLVDLYHGTIKVNSILGEGAEFVITLPIVRDLFNADEIDTAVAESTSAAKVADSDVEAGEERTEMCGVPQPAETVMVIEDNVELRDTIASLLSHYYNVVTADNGEDALHQMQLQVPDLIITDVMMPKMDGLEFTRRLKTDINTSHIPVIVLTAKNHADDRATAYELGADAYLAKPFDLTVLLARIKNLLRSRTRRASDFKNQLVIEMKEMQFDSLDESFITRAVEIIEKHLDDMDFDIPQFAKELGVSKTTLFNKLKSLSGMNPTSFIRNIRLKTSCRIMNDHPDIRISELAYTVGFNDPRYFSLCFKREFDMTPSEYADKFLRKRS